MNVLCSLYGKCYFVERRHKCSCPVTVAVNVASPVKETVAINCTELSAVLWSVAVFKVTVTI